MCATLCTTTSESNTRFFQAFFPTPDVDSSMSFIVRVLMVNHRMMVHPPSAAAA